MTRNQEFWCLESPCQQNIPATIRVFLSQALTIAPVRSTQPPLSAAEQYITACSLIMPWRETTMPGRNWAIRDGAGRAFFHTSKRPVLRAVLCHDADVRGQLSERNLHLPPPEELAARYPISGGLEPHGTSGPVGSSFAVFQYPVLGKE